MKFISKNFIEKEISNIGFDPSYLSVGLKKHKFLNLKIFSLKPVCANILKQTALSSDCDCAIHRHAIDSRVEYSDCVLSGTISQLEEVSKKLRKQPFSLSKISDEIVEQLKNFDKKRSSKLVGILNLTKNSFSDGGEFYEFDDAVNQAQKLINSGAKILDIGAESKKPKSNPINVEDEISKLEPVVTYLKRNYPQVLISVDTRNSKTAKLMLDLGVDIINDVFGLTYDPKMKDILAQYDKKVVIMHSRSNPFDMDDFCEYKNVVDEVYFELKKRVDEALLAGIKKENIIVDVGFGFAKNDEQNLELLERIEEFKSLGCEILCGVSRKRFLQHIINANSPKDADEITALTTFWFASLGIDYIRVHDIEKNLAAFNFGKLFNQ